MTENPVFIEIVDRIGDLGRAFHANSLLENARYNVTLATRTIHDLEPLSGHKQRVCMVVSAGPSVRARESINRIKNGGFRGAIVATDGTYIACLQRGVIPDFVISLDPHPSRIVRWFGDPDIEANSANDDYFERQDLNVDFRNNILTQNRENIKLVNEHAHKTRAIIATTVHRTVSDRLHEAGFPVYWWNPLVDNPAQKKSLTAKLFEINPIPCMNTGGTVGTAGWLFAGKILKTKHVGVVGMDYGYPSATPFDKTQTYYELLEELNGNEEAVRQCFVGFEFPLTGEKYYTDPTYYWYRRNFLDLHSRAGIHTVNCTEGGTLVDKSVECLRLDDFLLQYNSPADGLVVEE